MTLKTLTLAASIAAALAIATSSSASAQDVPECREVRRGVIVCTEIDIEGRTPTTYVFLARAPFQYAPPPLRNRRGVREIVEVVERDPF